MAKLMERLRRRDRAMLSVAGIALAVVGFFALNLFATLEFGAIRLDLTRNGNYTVSRGTKDMLAGVTEPITLRLYSSRALLSRVPGCQAYAQRVRETLEGYARLSGGSIRLEVVDPEPFSPEEDQAAAFGISAVPFDSAGGRGFFGVVGTNSTDDTQVIPLLAPDREPFLEYDLTRLVYDLAHPEKPVLAVLDGSGIGGTPEGGYQPAQMYLQIEQFFDVRLLAGDVAAIDDDAAVLMIVHPYELGDATLLAIDRFVHAGGPALVFVDPLAENKQIQAQMGVPRPDVASNLARLMTAWGVALAPGKVVGDAAAAMRVQTTNNGREVITNYLPWISLGRDAVAPDDPVTAPVEVLRLFSAGALESLAGATTTFEPLVRSSAKSMLIDQFELLDPDPVGLLGRFAPSGQNYVLAARITGDAPSAFPDGLAEGGEATGEAVPGAAHSPIAVIVVGDVDMLEDNAWLSAQGGTDARLAVPIAHNADFVLNALENLAGGAVLAELRGRGLVDRSFTTVKRIRAAAETKYMATVNELSTALDEAQSRLQSLDVGEQTAAGTSLLLTPEQQATVREFRGQVMNLRGQLREVQRALNRDIERLETWVALINIAAVPVLVAVCAGAIALWRTSRRRRAQARA